MSFPNLVSSILSKASLATNIPRSDTVRFDTRRFLEDHKIDTDQQQLTQLKTLLHAVVEAIPSHVRLDSGNIEALKAEANGQRVTDHVYSSISSILADPNSSSLVASQGSDSLNFGKPMITYSLRGSGPDRDSSGAIVIYVDKKTNQPEAVHLYYNPDPPLNHSGFVDSVTLGKNAPILTNLAKERIKLIDQELAAKRLAA